MTELTGQPDAIVDSTDPAADQPPAIGHPAVDSSLRALAQVTDAPPADQLPAYQAAHRTFREVLASIDEADSGPAPGQAPPGQGWQPERRQFPGVPRPAPG
jgi:hypothetical protein